MHERVSTLDTQFLSTPSVGRATLRHTYTAISFYPISIHALRGEGDMRIAYRYATIDISIHALRGEGDGFAWKMRD